jgi:hypothetical protein
MVIFAPSREAGKLVQANFECGRAADPPSHIPCGPTHTETGFENLKAIHSVLAGLTVMPQNLDIK